MANSNASWGTDTVISLPVAPAEAPLRTAGDGFGFSRFGLVHNLTQTDLEEYLYPTFAPLETSERE